MERKQTTSSVIAKLMGFDELQPQHDVHRPIKMLSEDYLRKTASIGMLEKRSVHLNRSTRGSEGKQYVTKPVFDVKPIQSTVVAQFGFARPKITNGSNAHPIDVKNCHTDGPNDVLKHLLVARTSGKMSAKRVDLKSVQKPGDGSGESGTDLDDLSRTHSESKDKAINNSRKIVVLKPNSKNLHPYARSLFMGSDVLHQGGNGDFTGHGSCLKPATKVIQNENGSRDMVGDIRLVDRKPALKESLEIKMSHRVALSARSIKEPTVHLSEASITPCQGSLNLKKRQKICNQFLDGSSYSRVANSNIFERWKAAKYRGELAVPGRISISGEIFSVHDGAKLEKLSSSESFCRQKDNSELCTSMVHSSKVISTSDYIINLPSPVLEKNSFVADLDPETSIEASQSKCLWLKETGTGYNFNFNPIRSGANDILPLKLNQGFQDESNSYMVKEADGHGFSDARIDFIQQKASYNSFKEELILTCGDLGPVKTLRENNQPSPDSVLEPALKEENGHLSESSCSITDLRGLAMKLHLLNNESLEEISSEGSVMAVSSDGDTEKGSVELSEDYKKQWGPLRPEESRDFSYLIDVLDEAALFGLPLETWSETWHETENPLSPSVFEALEKKYGKQTSWSKSERRLLFDYINSGLRSIQDSCVEIGLSEKSLRKRLKASLSKDDIEEELWMQLMREKEAKKDSSEKAFGSELKWLELDEDVCIICKEIVEFLFDELATEIWST